MPKIHHTQFDFSPEKMTPVVPDARKYIIRLDSEYKFSSGEKGKESEATVKPGEYLVINNPTEQQAKDVKEYIEVMSGEKEYNKPVEKWSSEQLNNLRDDIKASGLTDVYHTNAAHIKGSLDPIQEIQGEAHGLYEKKKLLNHAFYVEGEGIVFTGTSMTDGGIQKSSDGSKGAVILFDDKGEIRLIDPKKFLETYQHSDKTPIKDITELATQKPIEHSHAQQLESRKRTPDELRASQGHAAKVSRSQGAGSPGGFLGS